MIKNHTVYNGKLKLKFEKYPEYTDGISKLNKIHLNLGFTKLVSRIYIDQYLEDNSLELDTREYRQECIDKINKYTGGKIANHLTTDGTEPFNLVGFISKDGTYLGDVSEGWWYYNNQCVVSNEYPKSIAIKVKESVHKSYVDNEMNFYLKGLDEPYLDEYDLFDEEIEYIISMTHYGIVKFKIGDKLFDENYIIEGKDKKYMESIPYKERGKHIIKTWNDAKLAARNFSKYL